MFFLYKPPLGHRKCKPSWHGMYGYGLMERVFQNMSSNVFLIWMYWYLITGDIRIWFMVYVLWFLWIFMYDILCKWMVFIDDFKWLWRRCSDPTTMESEHQSSNFTLKLVELDNSSSFIWLKLDKQITYKIFQFLTYLTKKKTEGNIYF